MGKFSKVSNRKTKPALWTLAFPEQRDRHAEREKHRRHRDYLRLRDKFMRENPCCERCGKKAVHVHHKSGRGRSLLETETWAALCWACHRWVHDNPRKASKTGLENRLAT